MEKSKISKFCDLVREINELNDYLEMKFKMFGSDDYLISKRLEDKEKEMKELFYSFQLFI